MSVDRSKYRGTRARAVHCEPQAALDRGLGPALFLLWPKTQAERSRSLPNTIVQTQQLESRDGRACHEHRGKVDRIKCSNRLAGKGLPGALHNLRTDTQYVPMSCGGHKVCAPIGALGRRELAQCRSTEEHPLGLNQREIRSEDHRRINQYLTNLRT